MLGFGTGGILGAVGAHSWTTAGDFLEQRNSTEPVVIALKNPDNIFIFEQTRILLIATAVSAIAVIVIYIH